jgi:signal peptidase I
MTDVEPVSTDADPDADAAATRAARRRRVAVEWIVLIGAALVLALLIKTFLFQVFYIPSESMVPTLKVGDRVVVNKLSDVFGDVGRGDILVFEAPPEARSEDIADLVKRVVGLPGETLEGREGSVYVDGRRLDEPYLPEGTITRDFGPTKVPAGHLFMMGDNRVASRDSRSFGPIEESTVIGRVFLRLWPPRSIGLL